MLFAIKNLTTGEIDGYTLASSEEEAWDKELGFESVDDQWAWHRQKAENNGFYCVEVELIQKANESIDNHIKLALDYKKNK